MYCVLEGISVKVFGKAIHAISRVGDELWLDPMVNGLALRSVNSAQSAYTCFLFSSVFFKHYSLCTEKDAVTIKCKIPVKSLLPLFRCLTSLERNVKRCEITMRPSIDQVMILFYCRYGLVKSYNLYYEESEAQQAVFSSHLCTNVLKAPARLLADMVMIFPVSQEEITLSLTSSKVSLKNHPQNGSGDMKTVYAEMTVHRDEFDHFQCEGDLDITFCLKELRGFLSFADLSYLPVLVQLSAAGNPVRFTVEDAVMEACVVLSTDDNHSHSSPPVTPTQPSPRGGKKGEVHVTTSNKAHGIPENPGIVLSSQGSPINSPGLLARITEEMCSSVATTPASSTVCSLLCGALSSNQEITLPVLACYSDSEDVEED
ncbi:cell cycle checkpoint control protein RAD9B [Synchiropus splendidus]|uniref:cell cycle checkpoint control protein RAD9B n=1 Tax=Synchiropus splendidus TaxID=270530 RepID=UPI00237DD472|nr:cell cycle checkpoint control protein RAD9B [Synchiropus splendidus]XP_053725657.1 cell cycle checkpoint control protein RAD9B [Synchiropus splendidus]